MEGLTAQMFPTSGEEDSTFQVSLIYSPKKDNASFCSILYFLVLKILTLDFPKYSRMIFVLVAAATRLQKNSRYPNSTEVSPKGQVHLFLKVFLETRVEVHLYFPFDYNL